MVHLSHHAPLTLTLPYPTPYIFYIRVNPYKHTHKIRTSDVPINPSHITRKRKRESAREGEKERSLNPVRFTFHLGDFLPCVLSFLRFRKHWPSLSPTTPTDTDTDTDTTETETGKTKPAREQVSVCLFFFSLTLALLQSIGYYNKQFWYRIGVCVVVREPDALQPRVSVSVSVSLPPPPLFFKSSPFDTKENGAGAQLRVRARVALTRLVE